MPVAESGRPVLSIAADPSSEALYLTFAQSLTKEPPESPYIYRHAASAWTPFAEVGLSEDKTFGMPVYGFPGSLAVDDEGNVYVNSTERTAGKQPWQEVLRFSPDGACLLCPEEAELAKPGEGYGLLGISVGDACNLPSPDLHVAVVGNSGNFARLRAYGAAPDPVACPPPVVPPTIKDQFATSVGSNEATVLALINPHFWPDTTFYVEYGTGLCSAGGCPAKTPVPASTLDAGTVDAFVPTDYVPLRELSPDTTYHFRFVATSGGGGPVVGVDPDGEGPEEASPAAGEEGTFTTWPSTLPAQTGCSNQVFRSEHSISLPDCRAYEMVSPVDKADGDILVLGDISGYPAELQQSAESGNGLTYSSYRSFADNRSAPFTSQYLARRDPAVGWLSHGISPPRGPVPILKEGGTLQSEFRAFSADLCNGWVLHDTDPPLAVGAIPHYANLYRAGLCGPADFEALIQPDVGPLQAPISFIPELQGVSTDGSTVVFKVQDKLTSNAVEGPFQLYRSEGGALSLVSILPGGNACQEDASAGTMNEGTRLRTDSVENALSADGIRVYWSCGDTLYLREAGQPQSRTVSGLVSTGPSQFWTASPDGSKAIFTTVGGTNERLYIFNAKTGGTTFVAGKTDGVLGASDDLSSVYLLSREVRAAGAIAGEPNLYLYRSGTFSYIATLDEADSRQHTGAFTPSVVNVEPPKHAARVTPSGNTVTFMSTAPLTGFDNRDAVSGERDAEVFLFSSATGKLSCVSCGSTGARPSGRESAKGFWASGLLPPANSELYQPRYLSDNGAHLFFQSFEGLVPRDQNGKEDVYEFEPASSQAQCEAKGAESFVEEEEGCLSLISPGEGNTDNVFVDASPSGRDVFFTTGQGLVSWDPGLIDVYDAREGGGLPAPPGPPAGCEGTACQGPAPAPQDAAPASSNPTGSGNVKPRHRCPKGKRRVKRHGKFVCVKKHAKHHRRAGR